MLYVHGAVSIAMAFCLNHHPGTLGCLLTTLYIGNLIGGVSLRRKRDSFGEEVIRVKK